MSFDREERVLRALRALSPVAVAPDARVVVVDRGLGDGAPGLLVDLLDLLASSWNLSATSGGRIPVEEHVGPLAADEGFLVVAVGTERIVGYAAVHVNVPGRRAAIRHMHPEASDSAHAVLTLVLGAVHAHLSDMGIERLCVSARVTGRKHVEVLRAAGFRVELMTMSRDVLRDFGTRLEPLPSDEGDGVRLAVIATEPERSLGELTALVDGLEGLWRDLLDADRSSGLAKPIDPEMGWRGARRRHLDVMLSDNPAFIVVALRDAQPVGYVLVDVRRAESGSLVEPRVGETSQAVIVYLSVASAERGNGIGTRLMDLAERHLGSAGRQRVAVAVVVDSAAVGFYRNRGYGIEEVTMECDRDAPSAWAPKPLTHPAGDQPGNYRHDSVPVVHGRNQDDVEIS